MSTSFGNIASKALRATTRDVSNTTLRSRPSSIGTPWSCFSCRMKQQISHNKELSRRSFASTTRRRDEKQVPGIPDADTPLRTPAATSTALPSHTAKQRSAFSKRLSALTDSVLARASIAGQHINTYTGTDFSGIEALRKEIGEQEAAVKVRHAAVADAKATHTETRAKQAASQKEIVGLLERKSSWSPTDLERYMSLVRSEHIDEQAVQQANEELASTERDLEDTRSLLERLERKQYHEEQIWSDTIRRNSTWVTIGLMGVNILLLLAQISIFEPYRRRKIVKQIKEVLDERVTDPPSFDTTAQQIDAATEPEGVSIEQLDAMAVEPAVVSEPIAAADATASQLQHDLRGYFEYVQALINDLFSDRSVHLKQIDVTTVALESAAAGMAFAGMIALLLQRGH